MITRIRERRRRHSIRWRVRHDNPLGLTRQEYEAAETAQARILTEVMRAEDAPGIVEELKARAEAARRRYYDSLPPELTRDQMAAMLQADAIRASSDARRGYAAR